MLPWFQGGLWPVLAWSRGIMARFSMKQGDYGPLQACYEGRMARYRPVMRGRMALPG